VPNPSLRRDIAVEIERWLGSLVRMVASIAGRDKKRHVWGVLQRTTSIDRPTSETLHAMRREAFVISLIRQFKRLWIELLCGAEQYHLDLHA
jgi:hypothetical protein